MPHGSTARLYADGVDLSGWTTSVSLSYEQEALETTVLSSYARAYMPGLGEGSLSAQGFLDPAPAGSDEFLSSVLAASRVWLYVPSQGGIGSPGWLLTNVVTTYEIESAPDAVVSWSSDMQAKTIERVRLCTNGVESGPGPGTALDNGVATSNGGIAVLQLLAVSGGAVTVTIQHSADAVTWVDLASFAAASTRGAQRLAVTGAIQRYLRWTRSGTDTARQLVVAFGRF